MVFLTTIRSDGYVPLGDAARRLGFVPGTPVEVIVTRAGTLILRIDDSPALDLPFKPLVGGAAQLAIRNRRAP